MSYGDVLTVLPFGNFLVVKKVNASILEEALDNGLSGWTGNSSAAGRFPQVRARGWVLWLLAPAAPLLPWILPWSAATACLPASVLCLPQQLAHSREPVHAVRAAGGRHALQLQP